jgi:hypothetical protein
VLAILAVLLSANVGSWFFFGERALHRSIASAAHPELLSGETPPVKHVVVSGNRAWNPSYPEPVDPAVLREYQTAFAKHGLSAHTEDEFLPSGDRGCGAYSARGAVVFVYWIVRNSPFYARVHTSQFNCAGPSSFFHHRLWFFGMWLPIGDDFVGQE